MIRSDAEFRSRLTEYERRTEQIEEHRSRLLDLGLSPETAEHAVAPLLQGLEELAREVSTYQRIQSGLLPAVVNLRGLGELLTALRLAAGLSQRELAQRLRVHESMVCRDEKNRYKGLTVDRAGRVLEALGAKLTCTARLSDERSPGWWLGNSIDSTQIPD